MIYQKKFKIEVKDISLWILNPVNLSDRYVKEALLTLLHYDNDGDTYLLWNNIKMQLFDINYLWDDIINMLESILLGKEKFMIHWPSSDFFVTWEFFQHEEFLTIKSWWDCVHLVEASILELEKAGDTIVVSKKEFIEEWCKLLFVIKQIIINSGYETKKLKDFERSFSILNEYII